MKFYKWENYFKTLTQDRRTELIKALVVLNSDPKLHEAYNYDFSNLGYLLDKVGVNKETATV